MRIKKIGKWFLIANVGILALGFVLPAFGANIDLNFADPNAKLSTNINPIAEYIQNFYTFALWISGALAMLMIIAGGIRYATSAGKPDIQNDAKDMIFSALWGVLLLFGAVLILNTVNPQLKTLSVSRESLGPAANCAAGTYYCVPETATVGSCLSVCPLGQKRDANCGPCAQISIDCPALVTASSSCPGRLILKQGFGAGGTVNGFLFGQLSSTAKPWPRIITKDNLFYKSDLNLNQYEQIWTYPYYPVADETKTQARCVIYAVKKRESATFPARGNAGTCSDTTGICTKYDQTNKDVLSSNVTPC